MRQLSVNKTELGWHEMVVLGFMKHRQWPSFYSLKTEGAQFQKFWIVGQKLLSGKLILVVDSQDCFNVFFYKNYLQTATT